MRCGLAAPLPMSSSRFILLGAIGGGKSTHFYIHRLFLALSGNNWFNPATTPHSQWLAHEIYKETEVQTARVAEVTHVVKGGAGLTFQD